jgi:hypothetical protein
MISGVTRVSLLRRPQEQTATWRMAAPDADASSASDFDRPLTFRPGQRAFGFAAFLGFFALAPTGFRAFAGVMARGLVALIGAADGSGRKCARQAGLSWDLFWIMQTVMRSTSGM